MTRPYLRRVWTPIRRFLKMENSVGVVGQPNQTSFSTDHYAAIGATYSEAFFYEKDSAYEKWQFTHILSQLACDSHHTVVDLGGGTGRTAQLIYQGCKLKNPVMCVDNAASMLAACANREGVVSVLDGIEGFALREKQHYDRAMMKEVVHHLGNSDERVKVFKQIHAQLNTKGKLLIVTRPKIPEYPFFKKAMDVWSLAQPSEQQLVDDFKSAGFTSITSSVEKFNVGLPLSSWCTMIRNRFWSTFSNFTDDEIEEGVLEIQQRFQKTKQNPSGVHSADLSDSATTLLKFSEAMVFISGTKE
eukprot:m.28131 g.28131  ORF g.28131 m.28131 type:complete len:302 (+) comp15868_c0_seq2:249-1154(+)